MTDLGIIAAISILTAGLTVSFGAIGPALGEGRAASQALAAIAQQPDAASTLSRTLFVSLAMIEFDRHLLLRGRHDPDLCEPVLDRRAGTGQDGGPIGHVG